LVDLFGKCLDEVVVQGQALLLALVLLEIEDEFIGQLVPQLALPEIFELEEEVLDMFGGSIALIRQQVGDRVDIHIGES
jgi:hypothetical protein